MWNKYHAKKTKVDGITFDSKAEARRYQELILEQRAGMIEKLELQPEFILQDGFRDRLGRWIRPVKYIADFSYYECGRQIVEDVKGVETEAFKIKSKLFRKKYPDIDFVIVK